VRTATASALRRQGGWALVFLVGYLACVAYAQRFIVAPGAMPLYWPASGLALAVVVIGGLRWVLVVLVALLLALGWFAPAPPSFLPYAVLAPLAGVTVGGWLSRRDPALRPGSVRQGFRILFAGTVMAIVSGVIGGYGMWQAHMVQLPSMGQMQLRWVLGDQPAWTGCRARRPGSR